MIEQSNLKGDQPEAFYKFLQWYNDKESKMFLMEGHAGTGKTYLMRYMATHIMKTSADNILMTAPTHKAVKVLRKFCSNLLDYTTTHAALGLQEEIDGHGNLMFKRKEHTVPTISQYRIAMIDECSMINDELLAFIQEAIINYGVRIIFVGDSMQIPPVNHYTMQLFIWPDEIRDYQKIYCTHLQQIIRQDEGNPIIELGAEVRKYIYRPIPIVDLTDRSTAQGSITFIKECFMYPFLESIILPQYNSEQYTKDCDHIKIIGWRNKTVNFMNEYVRQYIYRGLNMTRLPKILPNEKLIADAPIVRNKRVIVNTNDEMIVSTVRIDKDETTKLHYYIVDGIIETEESKNKIELKIVHEDSEKEYKKLCELQAKFAQSYEQGTLPAKSAWYDYYLLTNHFDRVKYNYAITAHKAQGSTYNRTVVLLNDIEYNGNVYEKNRILYTALTRPREILYVIY